MIHITKEIIDCADELFSYNNPGLKSSCKDVIGKVSLLKDLLETEKRNNEKKNNGLRESLQEKYHEYNKSMFSSSGDTFLSSILVDTFEDMQKYISSCKSTDIFSQDLMYTIINNSYIVNQLKNAYVSYYKNVEFNLRLIEKMLMPDVTIMKDGKLFTLSEDKKKEIEKAGGIFNYYEKCFEKVFNLLLFLNELEMFDELHKIYDKHKGETNDFTVLTVRDMMYKRIKYEYSFYMDNAITLSYDY